MLILDFSQELKIMVTNFPAILPLRIITMSIATMTWKLHHLCVDCWSSPHNSPLLDIYISSKWLENCATAFLVFCSNSFRKVRNSNTFRVVGLVGSTSEAVWISPSVSKLPNWEEHYVELMLERCLYSIIGCITIFISVVCMILYKPGSWYIKCCSQLR